MKKIMIALLVAGAAVASQAASVSWGAAAANPGGEGPEAAYGQYAYLVYKSTAFTTLATDIALESATDVGSALVGTTAGEGTIVAWFQYDNGEGAEGGSFTADNWNRSDSEGGVNGYYQIILANADHTKFAIENADAAVTGVTDSTGAGTVGYNIGWGSDDGYVGANGFNGTFTAAPEPTSGLLLLIGIAGLALRRRRA